MSKLTSSQMDVQRAVVSPSDIDALRKIVRGDVLTPESNGYDEARSLWNAMIDRRPALIVRCVNTEDIQQAVNFAKTHGLIAAMKGGGHNIAGNSCCDEGMVIDLSRMKAIQVDPNARTATVEPGVTLGELDAATQQHGLAVPVGINSTTGVAGLTLGGGFGWIGRKYGLTVDNLLSAKVVTANGEVLTASESVNPDLFWGIRGGGGNFGVVSSFTFRLNPVGPEVLAGLVVYPFDKAREMLRFFRTFSETVSDDITVWLVMRKAPPVPFVPEEYHGKEVIVFIAVCSGDPVKGAEELRPLRERFTPLADTIGPVPYVAFQQALDPLMARGFRNYWKTHNFEALPDELIDKLIHAVGSLPGPHCEVFIGGLGGAINRVSPDATAYHDRKAKFMLNVHARWETPAEDAACIRWSRGLYEDTARFATGEAYVNFMTGDESDRVRLAYGPNYDRLLAVKRKYDPTNLFHMNQNINPKQVDASVM